MSVVWCNGSIAAKSIAVDSHDRGLTLGDGVFETIAVIDGKAQWLQRHIERMKAAASELGLVLNAEQLTLGITAVLARSSSPSEVLRITLTRGVAARGLAGEGSRPSLLITLDAFPASNRFAPCKLATSKIRRNKTAPSARLKTLSYIDAIMAAREVAGRADEALMLNSAGHVASGTTGNIFLLAEGKLVTPSLDQAILPGIMRGLVIERAREAGFAVEERHVSRHELVAAQGLFCTNSLRFMRPVSNYDGLNYDTAEVEKLSLRLKDEFLKGS